MPIDIGSSVDLSWEAPTGNSVAVTVLRPDGSDVTPEVTESGGTFSATTTAELAGRYLVTWHDSTATEKYVDTFEVWPADPRMLISLDDAVQHLQWRAPDVQEHGDTIRLYIAAATPIIEDLVGAVIKRTVVQYADGGRTGVALWERPDEIISVEVDGTEVTDCVTNTQAAIVYRGRYGEQFAEGRQIVKITYTTGAAQIAPNIQLATRELVRHLWQVGQQVLTGQPIEYGDRPMGTTPSGFAVPKRVIELCASTYSLPGTA